MNDLSIEYFYKKFEFRAGRTNLIVVVVVVVVEVVRPIQKKRH